MFLSYVESLDQADKSAKFDEKERRLVEINTTAHVFDQELLANVLRYFKSIQSNVERNTETEKTLSIALMKHSK